MLEEKKYRVTLGDSNLCRVTHGNTEYLSLGNRWVNKVREGKI